MNSARSIILVRHATAIPKGFLYGRSDPEADTGDYNAFNAVASGLGTVDAVLCSPARRCLMTLDRLATFMTHMPPVTICEQLWEQDFGNWDGKAYAEVPDIGELSAEDLAAYRVHGGESFEAVCARVWQKLDQLDHEFAGKRVLIVAHAGVLRAASVFRTSRSAVDAIAFSPPVLGKLEI